jgi:hypothetical protein
MTLKKDEYLRISAYGIGIKRYRKQNKKSEEDNT